jgi:hypothetical protein
MVGSMSASRRAAEAAPQFAAVQNRHERASPRSFRQAWRNLRRGKALHAGLEGGARDLQQSPLFLARQHHGWNIAAAM